MSTPGITPGNSTGSNTGGSSNIIPVGAGDYVPLPNQPATPLTSAINNFAQYASDPAPPNQALVYSPDVRIIVAHSANNMQYDISADIVRGTLIRKENAASTLLWECHNKGLRYTQGGLKLAPLFSRMDRVVCYMKRAGTWLQVFSGYLDSVPYIQLYPGIVSFKATCTLKRLLCYWWNPSLPESQLLFNQAVSANQSVEGDGQGKPLDSGLGSILKSLLVQVGHWNELNVHIQNFPTGFMDLLQKQLQDQQKNQQSADWFQQMIEGQVSGPAPGAAAGYNTGAGAPGPNSAGTGGAGTPGATGAGSAFYLQEIVAACDALGMGPSTTNLNLTSGLQQSDAVGESARDQSVQTAFQQSQQVAKNYQTAVQSADAAILGVATATVESGMRNLANATVPESLNIPNDGLGHDGTSVGLFQQTEGNNWGTVAQRMNPRQAATMFFSRLQGYNWQNLDPGVACWDVQHALDQSQYEGLIDAAIPAATQQVQAYRNAKGTPGSSTQTTATSSLPVQQATSLAPSLGVSGVGGLGGATASPGVVLTGFGAGGSGGGTPGTSPAGGGGAGGSRPNPDSEGAVAFCFAQIGKPYVWGATGPDAFDCSGLLMRAFQSIGVDIGRDTGSQAGHGQRMAPANIQRGNALQCDGGGHTMMWLGDGSIIEASTEGVPIHRRGAYVQPNAASGIFQYAYNGGPLPGAPYNSPYTAGPGTPSSAILAGAGQGNSAAGGLSEPIAQNLFAYLFQPNPFLADTAFMFSQATPQKDFINAQPLIQAVQSVAGSSLRSFQSAPNGDFIAYYPDYFGMDGKPAVFMLEDVELKDFTLNFSDDSLATHVYVNGSITLAGEFDATLGWLQSMGYATVENQELYARMRLVAPGDLETMTGAQLMRRFGVRPVQVEFPMSGTRQLEFLLAVKLFMEKWAAQYQSSVGLTFMPDLFPGMRLRLASHAVQFYVQEVTHSFDFEQGFSTQIVATAPSNPNVSNLWTAANAGPPATTSTPTAPTGSTTPPVTPTVTT